MNARLFEKTFLLANISIKVIFKMLFPTSFNAKNCYEKKNLFGEIKLQQKLYPPSRWLNIYIKKIYKLDIRLYQKNFYNICKSSKRRKTNNYPFQTVQIVFLQTDKAFIKKFLEYLDYINIFLANFAIQLLKYININDYIINQIKDKKLFHKPIYNLNPVELKILKTYNKTYPKTGFI